MHDSNAEITHHFFMKLTKSKHKLQGPVINYKWHIIIIVVVVVIIITIITIIMNKSDSYMAIPSLYVITISGQKC